MRIDLQFHSTYSDGKMRPSKIVDWLVRNRVKVASLTDHNTVAGLNEFRNACAKKGIKAINGIELYARYGARKLNLLFYNFDQDDPNFHEFLRKTQIQRVKNVVKALEHWNKNGFKIDIAHVLAHYNHYIPVNGIVKHVIKDEKNLAKIKKDLNKKNPLEWEIIKYYFKNRDTYYLSETYIDIKRLVKLKEKIGGQIIVAHPDKNRVRIETLVKLFKKGLIDGIEVLSPHHSWDGISRLLHNFRKYKKIIVSGGSDFHGRDDNTFGIRHSWNYFKIDSGLLSNIEKIIK